MWPLDELQWRPVRVDGRAGESGFTLKIHSEGTEKVHCFTYQDPEHKVAHADVLTIVGVTAVIMGASTLQWTGLFTFAIILFLSNIESVLSLQAKQWHWCEHQMAALLEEGVPPSDSILKKQTPISILCGSVLVIAKTITVLCSSLIYWHAVAGQFSWILSDAVLALSGLAALSLTTKKTGILRKICIITALPIIMIALMIERLCFLRKPNEKQRQKVLEWGTKVSVEVARLKLEAASAYAKKHPR